MVRKKRTGIRELLRVDMRDKYRWTFFSDWEYRDLSAQHRFVPADPGAVRMNFTHPGPHLHQAHRVIESTDGGETWETVPGWHPPCDRGTFESGDVRMALSRASLEQWRSYDGGDHWKGNRAQHAEDLLYEGAGTPNCFSAIMIDQGLYAGRIVTVASYFLGQEGPDGELVASSYSDDWGATWHCSRLFGPPDPLPAGPEGFGEPAVVQLRSGWLWMVFRSLYGELWQCISRDGGETWMRPSPTGFVSPIANCYAMREPTTGATVLAWNAAQPGGSPDFKSTHSLYRPRTNLVFSVSHDNTRTWTVPTVIESEGGQYPTIHFAAGRMFIMYQSSPDLLADWHQMGLTLVAYDTEEVLALPAWTPETIQPWIDDGLVRHWRVTSCRPASRETIS